LKQDHKEMKKLSGNHVISHVLDIAGISIILYVLFIGLLLGYAIYTVPFFDYLAYHHTHSGFFIFLWIIFPGLLSTSLAIHLFHIIKRTCLGQKHQIARFLRTFLKIQVVIFLCILGWTLYFNKTYWGYWVVRPSLDHRIRQAKRLVSITPVFTDKNSDGTATFALNAERLRDDDYLYGREDPYYSDSDRIFMALEEMDINQWHPIYQDPTQKLTQHQLQVLYSHIVMSGKLLESTIDSLDGRQLTGDIVEYSDVQGENGCMWVLVHPPSPTIMRCSMSSSFPFQW
jgi:hypothetical protein